MTTMSLAQMVMKACQCLRQAQMTVMTMQMTVLVTVTTATAMEGGRHRRCIALMMLHPQGLRESA
jgi:hypothetical protein